MTTKLFKNRVHLDPFILMNNHRLLFCFTLRLLIISLTYSSECDEHSSLEGVPFETRVYQSPLVVSGISFNKNIDLTIGNLFNVTLLVQCILKGQPTERFIRIVQAGFSRIIEVPFLVQ